MQEFTHALAAARLPVDRRADSAPCTMVQSGPAGCQSLSFLCRACRNQVLVAPHFVSIVGKQLHQPGG